MGEEAIQWLGASTVAVFGIGGVGGFCVEALARAGVGKLVLFDGDSVEKTNLNRQLIALHSTIGQAPEGRYLGRAGRSGDIKGKASFRGIKSSYGTAGRSG